MTTAWIACDAAKVTPRGRRLRRCHRVQAFGHSRASAAALKARQKSSSEVRAVKRITMRTPSTSNCRMPAIQMLSAAKVSVSTANSRQPSNQFWRVDMSSAPSDVAVIASGPKQSIAPQRKNGLLRRFAPRNDADAKCNHQLHMGKPMRSIRVIAAYIHKGVMLGEAMRAAAKSPSAKPRRRSPRAPVAKPYHHGDLRRVLIDAALKLVGEGGAEAVSVREAAHRAGVSPGAPVRHLPSRDAPMNAVAEEAQRHFPRWGVAEADAEPTAEAIIDLFIDGIAKRPGAAAS